MSLCLAISGSLRSSAAIIVNDSGHLVAVHSARSGLHFREMPIQAVKERLNAMCGTVIGDAAVTLGIEFEQAVQELRKITICVAGLDDRFDISQHVGTLSSTSVFLRDDDTSRLNDSDVEVVVAGIAEACACGAFLDGPGLVVRMGVGCSVFGQDGRGNSHLTNAWGFLPGDLGGGYHIGRCVLLALTKAHDGRASPLEQSFANKALSLAALRSAPEFFDRYTRLVDIDRHQLMTQIKNLSRAVFELAGGNDPIANEILDDTSQELASGITAVLKRIQIQAKQVPIAFQGSLLDDHAAYAYRLLIRAKAKHPELVHALPGDRWNRVAGSALLSLGKAKTKEPFRFTANCKALVQSLSDNRINSQLRYLQPKLEGP